MPSQVQVVRELWRAHETGGLDAFVLDDADTFAEYVTPLPVPPKRPEAMRDACGDSTRLTARDPCLRVMI